MHTYTHTRTPISNHCRKELQQLAKENGIKANGKTVDMIAGLKAIQDGKTAPPSATPKVIEKTKAKAAPAKKMPAKKSSSSTATLNVDLSQTMNDQGIDMGDLEDLRSLVNDFQMAPTEKNAKKLKSITSSEVASKKPLPPKLKKIASAPNPATAAATKDYTSISIEDIDLLAESVTFVNNGRVAVDLSECVVSDDLGKNRFTLPPSTSILPGGKLFFYCCAKGSRFFKQPS